MAGSCRTDGGAKAHVALLDLTAEGCCLFAREPFLAPDQGVTIKLETLAGLHATVMWANDCLAGLRFDSPLYGPVYEHLVRTFAQLTPSAEQYRARGGSVTEVTASARQELLRTIGRAEAADRPREATDADRYNRYVREERRVGRSRRSTDH